MSEIIHSQQHVLDRMLALAEGDLGFLIAHRSTGVGQVGFGFLVKDVHVLTAIHANASGRIDRFRFSVNSIFQPSSHGGFAWQFLVDVSASMNYTKEELWQRLLQLHADRQLGHFCGFINGITSLHVTVPQWQTLVGRIIEGVDLDRLQVLDGGDHMKTVIKRIRCLAAHGQS